VGIARQSCGVKKKKNPCGLKGQQKEKKVDPRLQEVRTRSASRRRKEHKKTTTTKGRKERRNKNAKIQGTADLRKKGGSVKIATS